VSLELYSEGREQLRELFELAEDSVQLLESYLHAGQVLVARLAGGSIVGHVQIICTGHSSVAEIRSIAVRPPHQRRNVGRRLVAAATRFARKSACSTLVVATATADIENLRFYQRLGFRMRSIEKDVFTTEAGYPSDNYANGISVRDRVWFELRL
jgi:ribosomal protein S18 acetylase RimI-like enzyme